MRRKGYTVVNEPEDLQTVQGDMFIGLFAPDGLPQANKRNYTLVEMAEFTLKRLAKDPGGFFLMVEGSQIDWAGHANDADYLYGEMKDFNQVVQMILEFARQNGNILVLITADHETGGLSIIGGNIQKKKIKTDFASKYHTAQMVPLFVYGPDADRFSGIIDNTDIGKQLIEILSGE
jgi:alkaline phosphatase